MPFTRRRTGRVVALTGLLASTLLPLLATSSAATAPTLTRATVVYVADTNGDFHYGIYAAPANNPNSRQAVLPESASYDVQDAEVSPDGTKVAAEVDRLGHGDYSLEIIDVATRASEVVQQVSHSSKSGIGTNIIGFDWSRDGSSIVYSLQRWSTSAGGTVSYVDTLMSRPSDDSTAPTAVQGGAGLAYPRYSQDGTRIAGSRVHGAGIGFYVLDLSTHATTELAAAPAHVHFRDSTWSPDDKTLIVNYAHLDGNDFNTLSGDLLAFDPTAGKQNGLLIVSGNSRYDYQRPFFSMDGSFWTDRIDFTHCCSGDLFQFLLTPRGYWGYLDRTKTAAVDEGAATFMRPVDDGAPTSAATITGVTLEGQDIVLHWSVPAGLDDYGWVTVHFDNGTSTQTWHHVYGTSWPFPVTVGDTYTFSITGIFDGSGNQGPATTGTITAIATGAKIFPTSPVTAQNRVLPIGLRWGWTPSNTTGVTYDVSYKVKGGSSWAFGPATHWYTGTALNSAAFNGVPGQTYYFQSTVHDSYGNVTSSALTPLNFPYDQTIGHYSRGWATLKETQAWLGSIAATSTNGVTATYTVTGKQEMVIGDMCTTCGKFQVYLDGRYKGTVSTYAWETKGLQRQVLWRWTNAGIGSHTVKLVAVLAEGQGLRIDAIADPR